MPGKRILTRTATAAALLATYAVGLLAASSAQQAPDRLDPKIGAARPQMYRSVRDAKDWKNPYLLIRRDAIEVIANGVASGRITVAPADLRRTLLNLPVTAWPYGSVAAVQEVGIRSADDRAAGDAAAAVERVLAILKGLQITVERWPT